MVDGRGVAEAAGALRRVSCTHRLITLAFATTSGLEALPPPETTSTPLETMTIRLAVSCCHLVMCAGTGSSAGDTIERHTTVAVKVNLSYRRQSLLSVSYLVTPLVFWRSTGRMLCILEHVISLQLVMRET